MFHRNHHTCHIWTLCFCVSYAYYIRIEFRVQRFSCIRSGSVLRFLAIILPEDSNLEQQIINVLNQYVAENSGYHVNDKALEQICANEKSYDRLVNDQHYLMKTELTDDNTCVVQFVTEQGKVMTTYSFFNAVISEEKKK